MKLDIRNVRNTPYKLVLNDWNVVGIFERKDHKEVFVDKKHFNEAHKNIAAIVHAKTLPERIASVK